MSSTTVASSGSLRKRRLVVRDSLIFLVLSGVSLALFVTTLLLFHAFEAHRAVLGRRFVNRGEAALRSGHPADAAAAFRIALSYENDLSTKILLAQALADSGRTEEATNYFLSLRELRPGDGYLNLQLGRLYRRESDTQLAVNSYRASIFGDWQGDGALRRREVRLELSEYLAQQGQNASARDELLVAAGNAPETLENALLFGDRFRAMGDTSDALSFYNKALTADPHSHEALAKAGRTAFALGRYEVAYKLLTAALNTATPAHGTQVTRNEAPEGKAGEDSRAERQQLEALAASAHRLPELNLSRNLSAVERADHLILAAHIAQNRLAACQRDVPGAAPQAGASSAANPFTPFSPALQVLRSQWQAVAPQLNKRALARDAALEDSITQLVYDTESEAVASCGPPQGDDALLLKLATDATTHP